MKAAYAGIDVAFAKRKRLPVVVCTWENGRLVPLPLRRLGIEPPRGKGNALSCEDDVVRTFAGETAEYLRAVESAASVTIKRIGIDAPSAPRSASLKRRAAEAALDGHRISCFTTPTAYDFALIRDKVRRHLELRKSESTLPHANQLWMQVGFALFSELSKIAECLEVYPQATVRQLGLGALHKSRTGAVDAQLESAALRTGWPSSRPEDPSLRDIGWGPRHDLVDAYLSAWVAALDERQRTPIGVPPDDAIWIPGA